jgi:hypothetical protein
MSKSRDINLIRGGVYFCFHSLFIAHSVSQLGVQQRFHFFTSTLIRSWLSVLNAITAA